MITAVNVTKHFGEVIAVSDVNVTIKNGEVFGLIGTNGAGKSTFLRMAAGVLKPDSGKIFADDKIIYENASIKVNIFYISDEQYFLPNATPQDIEMARVKGGMNARKKHNRVLKLAKGYRGARSKQYRVAKQSVMRALTSSYAGRKQRKRQFRQLWIARINAAARINGLSYSKFMYGLKLAGVEMNRKMLAEMAVNDAEGFAKLVDVAKEKLA